MTSPVWLDNTTYFNGNNGTHNVTMPSGIAAGDLLVMSLSTASSSTLTIDSIPAGWVLVNTSTYDLGFGTYVWLFIYAKSAAGGEGTQTVTLSNSYTLRGITSRFEVGSWNDTGTMSDAIATGTASSAASGEPDPPSISAPWGTTSNLVLVTTGWNNANTVVAYPSGYSNGSYTSNSAVPSASAGGLAHAMKATALLAEDPGAFDLSGTQSYVAQSLFIRNVASGSGLFFGPGF